MRTRLIAALVLMATGWTTASLCAPRGSPPEDPKAVEADKACGNVLAVYASNSERDPDLAAKLPQWKSACEHHPLKPKCDDVVDTLQKLRPDAPRLTCGR